MNFTKKMLAAAAILVGSTGAMASGLIGDTMSFQYYYPDLSNPYGGSSNGSFVVGSGVEVSNVADGVATLDVQNNKIEIDFDSFASTFNSVSFNGFVLSSSTPGVFGAVTVDAATTDSSFSSSFLSNTGNSLSVNWEGMSFSGGEKIVLDIASPVPEANTTAMMLAGLFVVAGIARRRRSV